jgi:glycosyltransferase involved in cell wall biosynthesis
LRGEADSARLIDPVPDLPTISIVTPSYQQGPFLEWTLRSVILQDYPKLEYVVMDGGSTDQTLEILGRYQGSFKHWESAKDAGHADAVKRGFEHTSGEIMAFLNSDDVLAPGALDFAGRFFAEHPGVDFLYSHRVFISADNTVESYWILPPHWSWAMRRWDYIPQETCFWRRSLYDAVGGMDPSFQFFGLDYDLFVRFMARARIHRANRFLGAFRAHPGSGTVLLGNVQNHPGSVRIRRENRIVLRHWHWIPERILHDWIVFRSRRFAESGTTLPGALAGVGYDYDRVWDGRLNVVL